VLLLASWIIHEMMSEQQASPFVAYESLLVPIVPKVPMVPNVLNSDSSVPADSMSEEQTFRSEVGQGAPCPYISGDQSSVLQDEI
jgi:hypothetical protein